MTISIHNLNMFASECERQQVGPMKVFFLAEAWNYIRIAEDITLPVVHRLGQLIEPQKNMNPTWRQTEVTIHGTTPANEPAPAAGSQDAWHDGMNFCPT